MSGPEYRLSGQHLMWEGGEHVGRTETLLVQHGQLHGGHSLQTWPATP